MSTTWKWILGILFGLIVIAVLGALVWNTYAFPGWYDSREYSRAHPPMWEGFEREGWDGPRTPRNDWRMPMMEGYDRFHRPMGGYGYLPLPFLFGGGLLQLLVPLGVLALVGLAAYQLGLQAGQRVAERESAAGKRGDAPPGSRGRKQA